MENLAIIGYVEWVIVILTTIMFFGFYSKKYKSFSKLLFFVLFSTWIVISIVKGFGEWYSKESNDLFSIEGFTFLMARTLPILLIFGGLTFYFKYRKFN